MPAFALRCVRGCAYVVCPGPIRSHLLLSVREMRR